MWIATGFTVGFLFVPGFTRLVASTRLAARARELVDEGTALEAACRIIILEDQLAEALRINEQLRGRS
ncbi:hypothetical protein [Kribbella capetownensis]|uniref:hypothetical protein n=1 Tax=Kribbella capetownensis TaxID=1572659 RepID=UPI00192DAB3D|nr:hypothetical protein [Kribbella capetownensis]